MLWKKIFCMAVLAVPFALSAAENLLPTVKADNRTWYQARNSECTARFECDEKASSLRIEVTTQTGYANYRSDLQLAPATTP